MVTASRMRTWEVFIKDHHEGYISWAEYGRNQVLLAGNAYVKVGDTKSGRGGRALLAVLSAVRVNRRAILALRIASSANVTLMAPLPMTIRCRLIGRASHRREVVQSGEAMRRNFGAAPFYSAPINLA
jgi:hypothetical protein